MPLFQPGQSGNPGGRPKANDGWRKFAQDVLEGTAAAGIENGREQLKAMALGYTSDAVPALLKLDDRTKLLQWFAEHAYGKATQPIAGDEGMDPLEIVINRGVSNLAQGASE